MITPYAWFVMLSTVGLIGFAVFRGAHVFGIAMCALSGISLLWGTRSYPFNRKPGTIEECKDLDDLGELVGVVRIYKPDDGPTLYAASQLPFAIGIGKNLTDALADWASEIDASREEHGEIPPPRAPSVQRNRNALESLTGKLHDTPP